MPNYSVQDIDALLEKGVITPKDRALLRQDLIIQANQEEGYLRKILGHLSHEVTEGWKGLRAVGGKKEGTLDLLKSNVEGIAGALQLMGSLSTSIGHASGEKTLDFLVKRGVNPTVAALAATVVDIGANVATSVGTGLVTRAATGPMRAAKEATKAAKDATLAAQNKNIKDGLVEWMEQTVVADARKATPPNAKGAVDIIRQGQDIPLAGKAGVALGERKALAAPQVEKVQKILETVGEEGTSQGEVLAEAFQALKPKPGPSEFASLMANHTDAMDAAKELNKTIPKVFRVDPGIAEEMKYAIRSEKDPFALFSIALDQQTPNDIRRLAANRLNDINQKDVLNYIRVEAPPEVLQGISRSNMFPSTLKSFAKAAPRGGRDIGTQAEIGAMARARQAMEEGATKYEANRMTIEGLQKQARESQSSIADVINLQTGAAKTPQEIANISQPVKFYGETFVKDVDEAEALLEKGDYSKFWQAMVNFHTLVQAHWPYMAPRQTAGQALKTYDEPVLSATHFLQQVPKLASWLGKLKMSTPEEVEANAALILREMQKIKSPGEIANFSKTVAREMAEHGDEVLDTPGFRDYARFYFVNSLMSGTDTIGRNISGNVAGALWHYPEKVTSSIAAKAINPFLSAEHHIAGGYLSEANTFMSTWARSMWDASRYALTRQHDRLRGLIPDEKALEALMGNRYDLKTFATTGTTNPFKGRIGKVIGTPVGIAQAADEVGRIALYRAFASEQLKRNWIESKSTVPWGQFLEEGLSNLPPSIHEYALRNANQFTFSDKMTKFGQGIANLRELVPGAELIAPFVRTADRLTAFQYNRSPVLSILSKRLYNDLRYGDADVRAEAVGRVLWANIVGTGLFVAAKTEGPDGMNLITGGGPVDRDLARQMKNAKVHLPYTIWTPFGRQPYAGLAPIRGPLGIIADSAEIWDELNEHDASALWAGVALGLSRNFFDTTYTKQLSDVVSIWDDPDRSSSAWSKLSANIIKGFVEPAIARQFMREVDPVTKESHDFWQELTREVPGYGGPVKRNPLTMEPVMNPPRLLNDIPGVGWFLPTSPIQPATDALANKIRELGLKVPEFPRAFAGNNPSESPFAYTGALGEAREAASGVPIPDHLRQRGMDYIGSAEDFGQTLTDEANALVSDPEFNRMAPIDQADAIKGLYNARIGAALERLKSENPELLDAYEVKMQKRAEVRMPPEEREAFEKTIDTTPEMPVEFIPLPTEEQL